MSKWPMVRLDEVFALEMGKTPARDNSAYWGGDAKWASIADIGRAGMYLEETKESITQLAVSESGIKLVPANTVVMSFKLSIGKTAITKENLYTNEAIMAFHPLERGRFDLHYLYHLFSNKNWSEGSNKAVMGATLNKATLKAVKIPVPSLDEQQKIAQVLDKINEVANRTEGELAMLDQLVKSRFVEMFGDPLQNAKKWAMRSFGDVCSVRQGLQIPITKRLVVPGSNCYEYITVAYLHGAKSREYIENPKSNVICRKDDILMTRTGNTGMVVTDVEGVFHNNFFLIDFDRKRFDRRFLVHYLNLPEIQVDIRRRAGTSTIPDLNHGEFYKIRLFEPPLALQCEFAAFVAEVDKSKFAVRKRLEKARLLYRAKLQEYFG